MLNQEHERSGDLIRSIRHCFSADFVGTSSCHLAEHYYFTPIEKQNPLLHFVGLICFAILRSLIEEYAIRLSRDGF
jgi:hypothetical protein